MHVHNAKISVFYDLTSAQLYYQNAEVYSKRGIYVMSEIWDTELKEIYISQAIVCPRYVKIELQFPDKLSKFLILKHNDVVDADIQKHLKTVAKWSRWKRQVVARLAAKNVEYGQGAGNTLPCNQGSWCRL